MTATAEPMMSCALGDDLDSIADRCTSTWTRITLEDEILAVLDQAQLAGEPLELAFRRKEAALVALFAALPVLEARQLVSRLTMCLPDDLLAVTFSRFIPARRSRLLAVLADARRREAMRMERR